MEWYYLVAIGVLNAIGYIIFRASETQRCEFAKDPNSDSMKRKIFSRLLHNLLKWSLKKCDPKSDLANIW